MARHGWPAAACVIGVLLLSALLTAIPAGRRPFWSSDEARFALLAQNALEHGRWLVAEILGENYLNKPQLFFWLVALASERRGRVVDPTREARAFDLRPLAATAVRGLATDAVVFAHPDLRLSYDVYLRRRVVELPSEVAVRTRLAEDRTARVIMPTVRWEAVAPTLDAGCRILASGRLGDRATVVVGQEVP
jgi:hypothetical protein